MANSSSRGSSSGSASSKVSGTVSKITKIRVILGRQKLIAYDGDAVVYEYHCVIGRQGHETVPGMFHIFQKEKMHLSKAYGNTPMPYTMFFSKDGKAIHGTRFATLRSYAGALGLGRVIPVVGSHGCVGLTEDHAKSLYDITPIGTLVEIER